jgi:uncharacterized protein
VGTHRSNLKWQIYDDLVMAIPPEITVARCVVGALRVAVVSSTGGVGVCARLSEESRPRMLEPEYEGIALQELAACARSWNLLEASIGVAAINAYHNNPPRDAAGAEELSDRTAGPIDLGTLDPFAHYAPGLDGKKAAMIGHFRLPESLIPASCDLNILDQDPRPGDFPDSAAEFLLDDREFVFVTAITLANKTLPRLLELCADAFVVLVGPSTPLSPIMFGHGVSALAGMVFPVVEPCLTAVASGERCNMSEWGSKVLRESTSSL